MGLGVAASLIPGQKDILPARTIAFSSEADGGSREEKRDVSFQLIASRFRSPPIRLQLRPNKRIAALGSAGCSVGSEIFRARNQRCIT
jgi:hypothetical protein